MADFSDVEDKQLVQLVYKYEKRGKKVVWREVEKRMQRSKKSAQKLRMRLKTLKNRLGQRVANFPTWYFGPISKKYAKETPKCIDREKDVAKKPTKTNPIPATPTLTQENNECTSYMFDGITSDSDDDQDCVGLLNLMMPCQTNSTVIDDNHKALKRRPKPSNSAINSVRLEPGIAQRITHQIFLAIAKADVRQGSGKTEENVGELSPEGVSTLVEECALDGGDVFLDVGSGIGNVVTQVALERNVEAIGVEIRKEVALKGRRLLESQAHKYSALSKVIILDQDVRTLDLSNEIWRRVTVLFCHNTVFKAVDLLHLEYLCVELSSLRTVVLQQPFCHRHTARCTREFCLLFTKRKILEVSVTFKGSSSQFIVFDRNK